MQYDTTEAKRLADAADKALVCGKYLDQLDAEQAAWAWLEPIIEAEKAALNDPMRLLLETPKVGLDGGATVLYRDHSMLAVTVVFRDSMNFSRLIVWHRSGVPALAASLRDAVAEIDRKDERIEELEKALRWALPLAEIAMENHRIGRMQAGHNDITGTYKNGVTWVGIWQSEVDDIENARAILRTKENPDAV